MHGITNLKDTAIVCKPLDNYYVVKNFAYVRVKCQSETYIKYHPSIQYQESVSPSLKGMKYDVFCTNKTLRMFV